MRSGVLVSLAALALLAGCGGDDSTEPSDSRGATDEQASAPFSERAPAPLLADEPRRTVRQILRECGYASDHEPEALEACVRAADASIRAPTVHPRSLTGGAALERCADRGQGDGPCQLYGAKIRVIGG